MGETEGGGEGVKDGTIDGTALGDALVGERVGTCSTQEAVLRVAWQSLNSGDDVGLAVAIDRRQYESE